MMRAFLFAGALALSACGAPTSTDAPQAEAPASANLEIRDAWATPTPGGVQVAAGYITIVNATAADDRLVSISTPRAGRAEAHDMSMEDGVMRMRALEDGLVIGAGETVTLAPGGRHLMFFDVTQPFTDGEEIPLTLTFEHAGEISAVMSVRRPTAASDHSGH